MKSLQVLEFRTALWCKSLELSSMILISVIIASNNHSTAKFTTLKKKHTNYKKNLFSISIIDSQMIGFSYWKCFFFINILVQKSTG